MKHIKWDEEDVRLIGVSEDGEIPDEASEGEVLKALRCCEYGIYSRTLIFSLKYDGKKYIARTIADIMADKLTALGRADDFDVIVPIPISEKREKERGFNQVELIGKYLAKRLGIEMVSAVRRIKDTRPMKGLSPDERKENIKGAFSFDDDKKEQLSHKRVLLIDDFYTTGATALSCAGILKNKDISDITFMAFAAR